MATQANMGVFLGALFKAFKEKWHVDIKLKPGDDETPIHAHKIVLAARSKVFRDMLESDVCKSSKDETVTLSELNHEELEAFIEFMYNGSVPSVKLKQHVRSLYLAADKYEILHLQDVCRGHFISSLESSNALDVLELSCTFSDETLQKAAFDFIIKHMRDFVFAAEFKTFVKRNPTLAVEIMKAFLNDMKSKGYYR